MAGLIKYLPLVLPMIQKARRDPRVGQAITKALTAVQKKPGTGGRKR